VKGASYEYTPLADKGRISFGSSVIEIVHSPLHTPGSTSFLMDGILLFTGDTIMKEPKTWHSMAALESGTVFFEVKEGPYVRPSGLHVAEWAPDEGEPQAANVVSRNKAARVGERLIPIEKIS
jgi:hypothetical protein